MQRVQPGASRLRAARTVLSFLFEGVLTSFRLCKLLLRHGVRRARRPVRVVRGSAHRTGFALFQLFGKQARLRLIKGVLQRSRPGARVVICCLRALKCRAGVLVIFLLPCALSSPRGQRFQTLLPVLPALQRGAQTLRLEACLRP